jgi:hypothetical protein
VASPARGVLDSPAGDLTELPRPRLQRPVTIARDTEVLAGEDPAARIHDRRGQRPLMRIDPDHVARMIRGDQQVRRSGTTLLRSPHFDLQALCCWRTGRQHPGGRLYRANAPIRSGRSSMARTEVDTSERGHRVPRVRSEMSQTSVQPSTLTRTVARAGTGNSTPGSEPGPARAGARSWWRASSACNWLFSSAEIT